MNSITAFIAGLIFGLGLLISGMANPSKVTAFLDLTGLWDPSLLLVMVGAIAVAMPAFWLSRSASVSLTGNPIVKLPSAQIDNKLLLGSLIFGAGWGLAGICPGPALVLLGAGANSAWIFVLALLAGMYAYQRYSGVKAVKPRT